jgi:hypothetical protein
MPAPMTPTRFAPAVGTAVSFGYVTVQPGGGTTARRKQRASHCCAAAAAPMTPSGTGRVCGFVNVPAAQDRVLITFISIRKDFSRKS